ncbi:MAG TPA: class I SAM-dependent methyltransferase [Gaiellales bacterium]|jgi:SAM-dependent methyltransferase|nr:class I SAM-dependent methyltransferase [Gaiellales bacterium]
MKDYDPAKSFLGEAAEQYDRNVRGDEDDAVAFLAELAGSGPALELAIGTGRIGLPLAARGVAVEGIDLSPDMVAQLRRKPGGEAIPVTIGDFAEVPVEGTYRLVYIVFNTFFNLLHQDEQVGCFENVAAHLAEDGAFVIEARVPAHIHALPENQYVHAEEVGVDEVWLDVARYDPVTQRLEETHVRLRTDGGVGLFPIVTRYCYPSELDLMARIAGLRLKERWGGWNREPFDARSELAVSVYGR